MSLREKWNQHASQRLETISSKKAAYDLKSNFKSALIGIALFPEKPLLSNFSERRVYVHHKRLLNTDPKYKALFTEYSTAVQTLDKSEYLPDNTGRYHNMSISQTLWGARRPGRPGCTCSAPAALLR
jgi:hypothetical protein